MTTRPKGSTLNLRDVMNAISLGDLVAPGGDATVALATALAWGLPVFIPAGTWLMGTLNPPPNAIIFGTGNASILKLKDATNNHAINMNTGVVLKDFALDCNKDNQAGSGFHGINYVNAPTSDVHRVKVINPKGSGFNVGGTNTDSVIADCEVTGYMENGIRIFSAQNLTVIRPSIYAPDVLSTGDAIAVISVGNTVDTVVIRDATIRNSRGRGIACIGNGTKNIIDVAIHAPRIDGCTNHSIFAQLADGISVYGGILKNGLADGVRFEGDVINSNVDHTTVRGHTGTCIREVVNGSTPNFNDFTYNLATGNGSNVVLKVGANSVIV